MNIERHVDNETDIFWEKFKSERVMVGSDNYRAIKEVLRIGRILRFEMIVEPADNYKTTSDVLLSKIHLGKIEKEKEEIIKNNINNLIFIDTFKEIASRLTTDLGPIPILRMYTRLGILADKIKEADKKANLA